MSIEDLGRRATACKHWRWMDGMTVHGLPTYRVVSNNCDGHTYRTDGYDSDSLRDCVPDLSDPATLGCLLALVGEAWNACRISVCFSAYAPDETKRWSVPISFFKEQRDLVHVPSFYGSTQAEALVAALEAAP